ncbi:hypothetical protein [Nitratidesulfovibrio liaohensis]|uniref:hypothetical protein n=1 Tax=Nitratidesulfovibrio liaohensis TaxID=2604158 RepID=UPI00141FF581|nr:hypothetical protein [Nitratidesulfovibrio liaohensis]NHZ48172.1 hypothetical protein [Nitratidesulfovibrio liaohensis]
MKETLNQAIYELKTKINASSALTEALDTLQHLGKVYIIGGAIRDSYASLMLGSEILPSDLDLVIDTNAKLPICKNGILNSFGGVKCEIPSSPFPINYWRLCDTYAFRKGLLPPRAKNLPATTVFDINAVVADFTSGTYFEHNFLNSMRNKKISFNCTAYIADMPELQALRAIIYSRKLNFLLDERVTEFIRKTVAKHSETTFKESIAGYAKSKDTASISALFSLAASQSLPCPPCIPRLV